MPKNLSSWMDDKSFIGIINMPKKFLGRMNNKSSNSN